MQTKRIPLDEIVLDFTFYPRKEVNRQHVYYMRQAHDAGAELPPMLIDKKTRRLIDGFHRHRMYQLVEAKAVEVVEKTYPDDRTMLLDAIRVNADHGRALDRYDRTHAMLLGEKLHVPMEDLAASLRMTVEAAGELKAERVGKLCVPSSGGKGRRPHGKYDGASIPLKATISHLAGCKLTPAQAKANERLSGMQPLFYVNQILLLLENDLLDPEDERLAAGLRRLHEALSKLLGPI